MRDERSDPMYGFDRSRSPLWYGEIDHSIDDKYTYDRPKYRESDLLVVVILAIYSIEPENDEEESPIYDDELSGDLDEPSRGGRCESTSPLEEGEIEREE
jgi:hypothetical protein